MKLDNTPMYPFEWENDREGYTEYETGATTAQYAYAHILAALAGNPATIDWPPDKIVKRARALAMAAQ